jgi:hypothetical protein
METNMFNAVALLNMSSAMYHIDDVLKEVPTSSSPTISIAASDWSMAATKPFLPACLLELVFRIW